MSVPYKAFERADSWSVERQYACINGLSAWFTVAVFHHTSPEEDGYTDGGFPSAEERAKTVAEAMNSVFPARINSTERMRKEEGRG